MKRNVLITGATSGLGSYLAASFMRAGFNVVINGRDEKKLSALKQTLSKIKKSRVIPLHADIRTAEGRDVILDALRIHRVDTLVNNAAINPELTGVLHHGDEKKDIFLTNFIAPVALSIGFFEYFVNRGKGMILNINSVAGVKGSAKEPLYAASKAGLRGFSESVRDIWIKKNIRITDVYAGAIATGMSAGRSDIKTLMDPEELADYLVTLCHSKTFYVREVYVQKTYLENPV